MIDDPDTGQTVKIEPYRRPKDGYADATRPSNLYNLWVPRRLEHFRMNMNAK